LFLYLFELRTALIFVTAPSLILNERAFYRAECFCVLKVVKHIAVKWPICIKSEIIRQRHMLHNL